MASVSYLNIRASITDAAVSAGGCWDVRLAVGSLFHTVADTEGSQIVYSADNRERVGHNHQVRLDTKAVNKVLSGWRTGGQFRHYHPEHVGERVDGRPLVFARVERQWIQ
ncbi:DUF7845 domain-containing protein [Salinigranum halophilum]